MEPLELPASAFADPTGANRVEVARLAERALRIVLDHAAGASERPPVPRETIPPEWLRIADDPVDEETLLDQLRAVLDGCMNAAHPGYMAHMDPLAATASVIGALATAAVNNNMLSVELAPSIHQIETHLMRQLCEIFGLGPEAGGIMISGGTLANLQALAIARNVKLGVRESGIHGLERRPVILASEVAHTSIPKAAMMLGMGTRGVVTVKTNGDSRIDVDSLHEEIAASRDRGEQPFAVVAIAGTTTTGNIDHLTEIADIAWDHDLWFHVDAAYGGTLAFSDTHRDRLRGIERADSITFNPQKWLYVTKVCATLLLRRWSDILEAFRTPLPYYTPEEEGVVNSGEISVQGTRHPDALKLWLTLQHIGRRGLGQLIDRAVRLGERFTEEVRRRPFLTLATEPEMNIVCFRGVPEGVENLDAWNARLRAHLRDEHRIYLSLPEFRGNRWLRTVLLNPYTDEALIERLFQAIDAFAEK
jgi:L-2,4-diaminobutyrate decarboxylase